MKRPSPTLLILLLLGVEALTMKAAEPGLNPVIIAHRGASGYLPEHTIPAYTLAHAQGADFIEQDLVLTRDKQLICLHDLHLEATTNVAEVFPNRKRADGRFYAIDFDLAEIRTLKVHERLPNRFPRDLAFASVPTFSEAIRWIQGLDKTTGRTTGIYPELKRPSFHRDAGKPIEPIFAELVQSLGFQHEDDPIFVQCFEWESLYRLRHELHLKLPLIYLIGSEEVAKDLIVPGALKRLSSIIQGIGPSKSLIIKNPSLVQRCHDHSLLVHPYTFRADDKFPQGAATDYTQELRIFIKDYDIDGLFTDFPDVTKTAVGRISP